jgi:hypothetical protein
MVAGQPEPDPQKKKTKKSVVIHSRPCRIRISWILQKGDAKMDRFEIVLTP